MNSGTGFIGYLLNPLKTMCVRINEIQKVTKDNFKEKFIINHNVCAIFMETENVQDLYSFRKFIGEQCNIIDMTIHDKNLLIKCSSRIVPTNIDINIGKFTTDESSELFCNKWLQLFSKQLIGLHFTISNIQYISGDYNVVDAIITVESILNNLKSKSIMGVVC
jgi:hypothetical protein